MSPRAKKKYGFYPKINMGYGVLQRYGLWGPIWLAETFCTQKSMGYNRVWVLGKMGYVRGDCTPFVCEYPQCSLRWQGAPGDLSVLGLTEREVLLDDRTDAAMAVTESSTLLSADFVRNLDTTLAVVKFLRSPNI